MAKAIITVSVDEGLKDRVKAQGINVSEVCNNALHAVLVEERVKLVRGTKEAADFNTTCGYVPFYETLTEKDYQLAKVSNLAKKSIIAQIKKAAPDWDNEAGLMNWFGRKYDKAQN